MMGVGRGHSLSKREGRELIGYGLFFIGSLFYIPSNFNVEIMGCSIYSVLERVGFPERYSKTELLSA